MKNQKMIPEMNDSNKCPKCKKPYLVRVILWNGVEYTRCMECGDDNDHLIGKKELDILEDFLHCAGNDVSDEIARRK